MKKVLSIIVVIFMLMGAIFPSSAIVDLEKQEVIVSLLDSNGNGLEGANVSHCSNSWFKAGQTNSDRKSSYDAGEWVTLNALPSEGFRFKEWRGSNAEEIMNSKIQMNASKEIRAVFEPSTIPLYSLEFSSMPTIGGVVSIAPLKTAYEEGEKVTLTAIPASGYAFKAWAGTDGNDVSNNTLTMSGNRSVTAIFEKVPNGTISVRNVQELLATEQSTKAGNVTVLIEDGEYVMPRGLWLTGSNITYKSRSGNREAVILNGDFEASHIFWIVNDNVTIQNLSIGRVNNHGIQVLSEKDADNAVIRNVHFFDIKEQFIKGSAANTDVYSNNCIVEDCLFEFTSGKAYQYYTGGIDVHKGDGWIVRNNTFRNIISPVDNLTEGAIHFWSASRDTLIENNVIYNCDRGIMLGLDNVFHYGGIIKNNTIHTVKDTGIYLANADGAKVFNNTVYIDSDYPNAIEYRFNGTQNVQIINNLTNRAIKSRDGATAKVDNNVTNAASSWFKSVPSGDLHLNSSIVSIIDKAIDLDDVILDMDGDTRERMHSDIGADELNGAVTLSLKKLMMTSDKEAITACIR